MAYSSDEKQAATLRIVQGKPGFRRSSLATRSVDSTYEDVAELAHTSFFYEPDTVFYLIYLASNYYTRKVGTAISTAEALLDAIDDLLVRNMPVDDVSSLSSARRALQDMSSALSRNGVVSSQAYSRYKSAISRSKEALGRPVKLSRVPRGGSTMVTDVVMPRRQAKGVIETNLSTLKSIHAEILEAVTLLLEGVSSYRSAGIAKSVASRQIDRAAADLSDLFATLDAQTPTQRTSAARDALLRVLSNSASVRALAEASTPGSSKLVAEVVSPEYRVSAYGEGAAPTITGTAPATWPIRDGVADRLHIDFGVAPPVDVDLIPGAGYDPGIERAEVVGGFPGDFRIAQDLATPYPLLTRSIPTGNNFAVNGKTLYLIVDGTRYEVNFASDRNATQVASDISTAVGVVTTSVVSAGGFDYVLITYNNSSPPTLNSDHFMQIGTGVDNADDLGSGGTPWRILGPSGIVTGTLTEGWDGNDELQVQANDATAPTTVNLTNGAWPAYTRTAAQVAADITTVGGSDFEGDVDPEDKIIIRSELYGEGSAVIVRSGVASSVSNRTLATLGLVKDASDIKADVSAGVVTNRLNQDAGFNALAQADTVREVPFQAVSAVVSGLQQLKVTLLDQTDDPTDGWVLSELKVVVTAGDNAGVYGLTGATWVSPDLTLDLDRQLRNQVATNRHIIEVVSEKLRITARDSSTSSYIDVDELGSNSADTVLGLPTALTRGTVSKVLVERNDPVLGWVPADISRVGIRVGDVIVDSSGVEQATISGLSSVSSGVLDVEPVDPTMSLTTGFTVESAARQAYDVFETALQSWQSSMESSVYDEELKRIDRVIAPLLVLNEPSRGQVNTAYTLVNNYKALLDSLNVVLRSYSIPEVGSVSAAMRTMTEHGHDRARELLLQARFEDYFGVTARTASFSRVLMDAGSRVAVEDLNEPTKLRSEEEGEFDRVVASWEDDEDPVYELEEEQEIPDSPMTDYWPGDIR